MVPIRSDDIEELFERILTPELKSLILEQGEHNKKVNKIYRQTDKWKEIQRNYNQSEKHKEYLKRYS